MRFSTDVRRAKLSLGRSEHASVAQEVPAADPAILDIARVLVLALAKRGIHARLWDETDAHPTVLHSPAVFTTNH